LGLLSTWSDAIGITKRALGEGLMPVAKEFVTQGIKVTEMLREWITEHNILAASAVVLTGVLVGLSGVMITYKLALGAIILFSGQLKLAIIGTMAVLDGLMVNLIAYGSILAGAMVTHPVIATLVALAAAAALTAREWKKVNEIIEEGNKISAKFVEKGKEREKGLVKQSQRLLELSKVEKLNNDETKEAQEIIDDLEGMYGPLGLKIDKATGSILGMAKALELLEEKNRRMRATSLKLLIADLSRQYDEAKDKSRSFFSNQSAAMEKMLELEKKIAEARKELWSLNDADVISGEVDDSDREAAIAAAKAAAEARREAESKSRRKLYSEIRELDVSSATIKFQLLEGRVSAIVKQFPELETAAKKFLKLQWEDTPWGEIQGRFKDIKSEILELRGGVQDWQKDLLKFSQMPWVEPEQIDEMKKMLQLRDRIKKEKVEDQRFEDMAKQIREKIQGPEKERPEVKMRDLISNIMELTKRGELGRPGGLSMEEGMKRLQIERQNVLRFIQGGEGKGQQSNEPMAGAGRFGFAEYGKAIQNMFLKSDDPAKDTARNTKQANELLGTIDRGIQVLVSKPPKVAIYSE